MTLSFRPKRETHGDTTTRRSHDYRNVCAVVQQTGLAACASASGRGDFDSGVAAVLRTMGLGGEWRFKNYHPSRVESGTLVWLSDESGIAGVDGEDVGSNRPAGVGVGWMAHHPNSGAANFFGIVADQYFQASLDTRHRGDRSSAVSGASILALRDQLS